MNGFSNNFHGRQGEDEDMYWRIFHKKKQITRPVLEIGRYSMLSHEQTFKNKPEENFQIKMKPQPHLDYDGLSNLKYNVIKTKKYNLYTSIKVEINI